MTDEKIGDLLEGFANYYWSVPLKYVTDKIMEWHPDVTLKQINKVIKKCNDNLYWHHCYVETAAFDEPELVVEHLVVLDEKDLKQFIAARWDLPYADCDEKALFDKKDMRYDLPEADAIIEFARTELGVGLDFAK